MRCKSTKTEQLKKYFICHKTSDFTIVFCTYDSLVQRHSKTSCWLQNAQRKQYSYTFHHWDLRGVAVKLICVPSTARIMQIWSGCGSVEETHITPFSNIKMEKEIWTNRRKQFWLVWYTSDRLPIKQTRVRRVMRRRVSTTDELQREQNPSMMFLEWNLGPITWGLSTKCALRRANNNAHKAWTFNFSAYHNVMLTFRLGNRVKLHS